MTVSVLYKGCPFSPKLPLPMLGSEPHLTNDSLGSSKPITQNSILITEAVFAVSLYFTMGRPFPPKIAPSHGGYGPPSNTWLPGPTRVLNPNGSSVGSAVFAGLISVSDRQTRSPAIAEGPRDAGVPVQIW